MCLLKSALRNLARLRPAPADPRHRDGRRAEREALRLLRAQGLALVARNVRNRWGELDLIMRDGPVLVVVEVRWRAGTAAGGAAASIGPAKQARLWRCTQRWLAGLPWPPPTVRFDVVLFEAGRPCWLRDALQPPVHIASQHLHGRRRSR
ncbi:YraN family protein [Bordetella trematum]|uniref:YraN family protein n=1 Tax=Bordetella trematum TaxID=123899 RepID=UPI00398A2E76